MSAYANPRRESSTRLLDLHPETLQDALSGRPIAGQTAASRVDRLGTVESSVFDLLLDRLADRVAAAVAARLGCNGSAQEGEWLDSRQAADYLGLHRDTLRRLAAARAIPAEQDRRGCKLYFRRDALDQWRRGGGRARHLTAVTSAA